MKIFLTSNDMIRHKNNWITFFVEVSVIIFLAAIFAVITLALKIPSLVDPSNYSSTANFIFGFGGIILIFNQLVYRINNFIIQNLK